MIGWSSRLFLLSPPLNPSKEWAHWSRTSFHCDVEGTHIALNGVIVWLKCRFGEQNPRLSWQAKQWSLTSHLWFCCREQLLGKFQWKKSLLVWIAKWGWFMSTEVFAAHYTIEGSEETVQKNEAFHKTALQKSPCGHQGPRTACMQACKISRDQSSLFLDVLQCTFQVSPKQKVKGEVKLQRQKKSMMSKTGNSGKKGRYLLVCVHLCSSKVHVASSRMLSRWGNRTLGKNVWEDQSFT